MAPTSARILQVEDDPDQAMLFSQVLTMAGYAVESVPDAETALVRLTEQQYDLLLADLDLPGMQGDALIVTAKDRDPLIKTILFSNHAHVNDAAQAAGADAWFRKSEGILPLRELTARLLSERREAA